MIISSSLHTLAKTICFKAYQHDKFCFPNAPMLLHYENWLTQCAVTLHDPLSYSNLSVPHSKKNTQNWSLMFCVLWTWGNSAYERVHTWKYSYDGCCFFVSLFIILFIIYHKNSAVENITKEVQLFLYSSHCPLQLLKKFMNCVWSLVWIMTWKWIGHHH